MFGEGTVPRHTHTWAATREPLLRRKGHTGFDRPQGRIQYGQAKNRDYFNFLTGYLEFGNFRSRLPASNLDPIGPRILTFGQRALPTI